MQVLKISTGHTNDYTASQTQPCSIQNSLRLTFCWLTGY